MVCCDLKQDVNAQTFGKEKRLATLLSLSTKFSLKLLKHMTFIELHKKEQKASESMSTSFFKAAQLDCL